MVNVSLQRERCGLTRKIRVRRKGDARPCKAQKAKEGTGGGPHGVKAGKGFTFLKHPCGDHEEEARRYR